MKKILMGYDFKREGFKNLENKFEIIYPKSQHFSKEEIIERIADIDVLVPNFSFKTDSDIMDAAKQLKLIANYGVGYDNIDVDAATKRGITVTNTPQSVLEPTAELCFALILATGRRIGYYNTKLHNKERVEWGIFDDMGLPIYGKTLGIYGMGRIGQAVARRALASGMNIIYNNRHKVDKQIEDKYEAKYVDFDTLIAESDYLSLNAPATPETHHIINAAIFKKMKNTAVLINTARGSLVDENALVDALNNKDIYAAGLDVFENEPKINPALFDCENAILTPHIGTRTFEGRIEMQVEVAQNILGFFDGKEISSVNKISS